MQKVDWDEWCRRESVKRKVVWDLSSFIFFCFNWSIVDVRPVFYMMLICVVGKVCALESLAGLALTFPTPSRAPTSQTGQNWGGSTRAAGGTWARGIYALHNQNPCIRLQIHPVGSGEDVLAERTHGGWLCVSLTNTSHRTPILSTHKQGDLLT